MSNDKKIFISYSWKNSNQFFLSRFVYDLSFLGFGVSWDRGSLKTFSSIRDFISTVPNHDFFIPLIDENYFLSENCLEEFYQFYEKGEKSKILPIITSQSYPGNYNYSEIIKTAQEQGIKKELINMIRNFNQDYSNLVLPKLEELIEQNYITLLDSLEIKNPEDTSKIINARRRNLELEGGIKDIDSLVQRLYEERRRKREILQSRNQKTLKNILSNNGSYIDLFISSPEEYSSVFQSLSDIRSSFSEITQAYRFNSWPLIYDENELKKLKGNVQQSYCLGSEFLNTFASNIEKLYGMNVVNVGEVDYFPQSLSAFQIFGDFVIEFYSDPQITERISDFFQQNNNVNFFTRENLRQILNVQNFQDRLIIKREKNHAKDILTKLKNGSLKS